MGRSLKRHVRRTKTLTSTSLEEETVNREEQVNGKIA